VHNYNEKASPAHLFVFHCLPFFDGKTSKEEFVKEIPRTIKGIVLPANRAIDDAYKLSSLCEFRIFTTDPNHITLLITNNQLFSNYQLNQFNYHKPHKQNMCYMFQTAYDACHHLSQPEYRPCGIPHCTTVKTCFADDEMGGFCPECFLVDDFSQMMQRPWSYSVYELMSSTERRWLASRWKAKEIYDRMARLLENNSGTHDVLALVSPEEERMDTTRLRVAQETLELLLRDFWSRIKYNVAPQPTLAERMVITQLNKIVEMEEIKSNLKELRRRAVTTKDVTTIIPEVEVAGSDCCNICYELFGTADEDGRVEYCVKTNVCNHTFGNLCLTNWLSTSDNKSCPMCRCQLVSGLQPG
jgi:hypothetical protein